LTLCATLDSQARQLAETPGLQTVLIDLREATNVDSTALGFLAKVAMAVQGKLEQPPTIIADNPDVRRMLDVMGFARYFSLVDAPITEPAELRDLAVVPADEEAIRQRILEAHRILMHMNEHNREEFQPLVEMLEAQEATSHHP
jgi:anti-anti-sigma regulatory factor